MFILQKSDEDSLYKNVFFEIKKGLFQTERDFFSKIFKRCYPEMAED